MPGLLSMYEMPLLNALSRLYDRGMQALHGEHLVVTTLFRAQVNLINRSSKREKVREMMKQRVRELPTEINLRRQFPVRHKP
jgi:hypothetical protein